MIPPWLQLLRQHRREKHFALTFSFLLGAGRQPVGNILTEEESLDQLQAMLVSMRDFERKERVRVFRCLRLWQPVASLDDQQSSDEISIKSSVVPYAQMYVARQYLQGAPPNIDTLTQHLWQLFRQPVNEGLFSYSEEDETFYPFNTGERAFIHRAFADVPQEI